MSYLAAFFHYVSYPPNIHFHQPLIASLKTIFNASENYCLDNDRVILRPLERSDFANLLPYSCTEQELWEYSVANPSGPEGLERYLDNALTGRQGGREYPFVIYDKLTMEYAGSTRFHDINSHTGCLQIGYTWLGKRFHGTGLNRHCKFLMLSFAFETIGFHRVEFRADHMNARSINALKSIGCVEEGILRGNGIRQNGERRDTMVFSIMKHEWDAGVKGILESGLHKGNHVVLVA